MAGIAVDTQKRRFDISRCHRYREKGEQEVEKCTMDSVEKEYRIPTVWEGAEDIIELNIPQAKQKCQVFKFVIPEVTCRVI